MVKKDRNLKESKLSSMAMELVDPSHHSVPKEGSHRRRGSVGSQKHMLAKYNQEVYDSLQNSRRLEIHYAQRGSHALHGQTKKYLKNVRNELQSSEELLQVMNRIWVLEKRSSTCDPLFTALKEKIDGACNHVSKLIQEQRSGGSQIVFLLKQFEEEKAAMKFKEHDRIQKAISSIAGEVQKEKKLRRQTERLSEKLGKELADTKASMSIATLELENEKRAREILQQVCDELAKRIRDDRAQVEEIMKQSEKVCEEVEKEREMLQIADLLREERVHMKLSEAKNEFEEKSAVVDMLKNELEACLKTKFGEIQDYRCPSMDKVKELERYLKGTLPRTCLYRDEAEGENNSADSDFHSLELNMNDSRISYDKTERQNICLERVTSGDIEWEFSPRKQGNIVFDFSSGELRKNYDDEIERHNMIKDLRDQLVSSSKRGSSQGIASPTKQWEVHSFTPQDKKGVKIQGLHVMQ